MNRLADELAITLHKRGPLTYLGIQYELGVDKEQALAAINDLRNRGVIRVDYAQAQQPVYRLVQDNE